MSEDASARSPTISSGPVVPARPSARPVERALVDVVSSLDASELRGDATVGVTDVVSRSDDVAPGALFCCVPGDRVDGHAFALDARERGARALLVERWLDVDLPQVRVPSVRGAMGPVASGVFGKPSEHLTMVGVTGTNGKTTTTYLLESVFRAAGMVPGVIGTTGARVDGEGVPFAHTTPEAPDLHRLLARMVDAGVGTVAMEVSSHGLEQHRVDGVRYACAVFTNLTQDHLDYHGTMESYFSTKARLFQPDLCDRAVINGDDEHGRRLARGVRVPTTTFGVEAEADVRALGVVASTEGIEFVVDGLSVRSRLRGRFNVSNCVAAFATARVLGIDDAATVRGIGEMSGVPGRMETVQEGQPFLVMIDYAHTPDSVENVLRATSPLASGGRLIIVLGCGGDRDRAKRPLMGRAATSLADLSVITSDNPRSEDPLAIIGDIEPGAAEGGGEYEIEPDRRAAIRLAVREAGPGDVVVIAGKGHESGQQFADRTIPFDDRVVAAEELRELGKRS
jgi:UDP-N-acetylmuramoyl-L-alanyl-D-glutamate--2,6-diaminopimelate ligase